jgi:hypothetical protein
MKFTQKHRAILTRLADLEIEASALPDGKVRFSRRPPDDLLPDLKKYKPALWLLLGGQNPLPMDAEKPMPLSHEPQGTQDTHGVSEHLETIPVAVGSVWAAADLPTVKALLLNVSSRCGAASELASPEELSELERRWDEAFAAEASADIDRMKNAGADLAVVVAALEQKKGA